MSTAVSSPECGGDGGRSHFDFSTHMSDYVKKTSAVPLLTALFTDACSPSSDAAVRYVLGVKTYGRNTAQPGGERQALTVVPVHCVWMERKDAQDAAEDNGAVEATAADAELTTEDDEPELAGAGKARRATRSRTGAAQSAVSAPSTWPEGYDPRAVQVRAAQIQLAPSTQSDAAAVSGACDGLVALEASPAPSTLVRPVEWVHNKTTSFIVLREPGVYRLSFPSHYSLRALQWSLVNSFTSEFHAWTPPAPRARAVKPLLEEADADAARIEAERTAYGESGAPSVREGEDGASPDTRAVSTREGTARPLRATIKAKQEEVRLREEEAQRLKVERRQRRGISGQRKRKREREPAEEDRDSPVPAAPVPARVPTAAAPSASLLLTSAPKRKSTVFPHHCHGFDWRVVAKVAECVYAALHGGRSSSIQWPQIAEMMAPVAALTSAECRALWRFAAYEMDEAGYSNTKRLALDEEPAQRDDSDVDVDLPTGVLYVGHRDLLEACRQRPKVEQGHTAHGWTAACDHALLHALSLWSAKCRQAAAAASLLPPPLPPAPSSPLSAGLRYLPSTGADWEFVSELFRHYAGVDKSAAFLANRFALLSRSALTVDAARREGSAQADRRAGRTRLLSALHVADAERREEALHSGGRNWEKARAIPDRRLKRRRRERRESSKQQHQHQHQHHGSGHHQQATDAARPALASAGDDPSTAQPMVVGPSMESDQSRPSAALVAAEDDIAPAAEHATAAAESLTASAVPSPQSTAAPAAAMASPSPAEDSRIDPDERMADEDRPQ